jgi:hypothetical protein
MKHNLIPRKKYLLKHTGEFSHAVGTGGFVPFSNDENSGDSIAAIFIGTIPSGAYNTERNIFFTTNRARTYLSFSNENIEYVIKEL